MRIVSGGQTGVDRAALDVALERGLRCGGWCPSGRRAEDGPIAPRYPLVETSEPAYAQRTEWNVRDSDGTLVLNQGAVVGGTAQTVRFAKRRRRPCMVVDLKHAPDAAAVRAWIRQRRIKTLNVAGPRESKRPGIYRKAAQFLRSALPSDDAT